MEITPLNYGKVISKIFKDTSKNTGITTFSKRANLAPSTLNNWIRMEHSPDLDHLYLFLNYCGYHLEVVKNER